MLLTNEKRLGIRYCKVFAKGITASHFCFLGSRLGSLNTLRFDKGFPLLFTIPHLLGIITKINTLQKKRKLFINIFFTKPHAAKIVVSTLPDSRLQGVKIVWI